jgi:membrane associated rhomboid family serine protease
MRTLPMNYAYLRYVLLINILVALPPSMRVKGRANDPLLHATWWTIDQHSAVLVVAAAAIFGAALALVLNQMKGRKWWAFVLSGVLVGIFPATFYYLAAPVAAVSALPLADMYASGTICGVIGGFVLYGLLRKGKEAPAAA